MRPAFCFCSRLFGSPFLVWFVFFRANIEARGADTTIPPVFLFFAAPGARSSHCVRTRHGTEPCLPLTLWVSDRYFSGWLNYVLHLPVPLPGTLFSRTLRTLDEAISSTDFRVMVCNEIFAATRILHGLTSHWHHFSPQGLVCKNKVPAWW